jgi:hypothetical protein
MSITAQASQDFVDSVMAGNRFQVVADVEPTPVTPERKRHRSRCEDDVENEKRRKGEYSESGKTLDDVFHAIEVLTEHFDSRMNAMEDRLLDKAKQMINEEVGDVRKELRDRLSDLHGDITQMRDEHSSEYTNVTRELADIRKSRSYAEVTKGSIHLNIVIRNIPESVHENVNSKVNGLIRDGLKLRDISIESAERKESRGTRFPGVIIAKCKSAEHKQAILSNKKKLRESRNFQNVYITSDKSLQQRIFESNMRVLAETVGDGQLRVTGSRLQRASAGDSRRHGQRSSNIQGEQREYGGRGNSDDRRRHGQNYDTSNTRYQTRACVDKHRPRDMRTNEQPERGSDSEERWDPRT